MKTLPIDDHKQGIFFPFQFLKKGRGDLPPLSPLVTRLILQFKTKNNKTRNRRPKHANKTSQVPVKNLSDYDMDMSSLKYGLNHSFIDKDKCIKKDLAVEFESLVTSY